MLEKKKGSNNKPVAATPDLARMETQYERYITWYIPLMLTLSEYKEYLPVQLEAQAPPDGLSVPETKDQ